MPSFALIGTGKTAVSGDPIQGEVVVLAVYYRDARAAAEQYADQLAGKVVVDITNPLNPSEPMMAGEVAGHKLDVLIAGDDEDAKGEVAALARDGGLKAIDTGPLTRARELEAGGLLHIRLRNTLGTSFGRPSTSSPD